MKTYICYLCCCLKRDNIWCFFFLIVSFSEDIALKRQGNAELRGENVEGEEKHVRGNALKIYF